MAIQITEKLKTYLVKNHHCPPVVDGASDETIYCVFGKKTADLLACGRMTLERYQELTTGGNQMSISPQKVFSKSPDNIRVKAPSEIYNSKKYSATHAKTGQPVIDEQGFEVTKPSQLSHAKSGALIKHLAYKAGISSAALTEHERALLDESCANDIWAGEIGGEYYSSIHDAGSGRVKALLDDGTSGGLEISPIEFDADIVSTPQLHGELFPFIDRKEVSRGRRMEGASISNITVTSGEGTDASQMNLFTTDDLISELNTTIYSVGVAIEIGRDHMADAAVDIGRLVQEEIGQSMLAWLDEQIAIGDGVSEPQGIAVASGTTTVAFGSATSISNYESLLFSVPKAQRPRGNGSVVFCANEVTYQRARAIPVGAGDDRRIFGMTHEDYTLLSRPYKISTALGNTQAFFGDLKKYRMYRRIGMALEVHTQGDYLARRNLALIVARARFGGRVVLPSSFGVVTDAPA